MDYTELDRVWRQGDARHTIPGQVVETLSALTEGGARGGLGQLAAMRHPLGFLCLPLQRVGELGVCVHVWTAGIAQASPTTSPAHSHSWDLRSFVLYGRVRNELVQVEDDPVHPTHRIFEVHSHAGTGTDEIRATPRLVRSARRSVETSGAGQTYDLPAGTFHMTVIEGEQEAATVVLGQTRPESLDLSLGALHTRTHQVRRQRCDDAETAMAARAVVRRLTVTT